MLRYIHKRAVLISFLILVNLLFGEDIRVCLWQGKNPDTLLKKYKNTYEGHIYLDKYNGKSVIVNQIDVEDYLKGVLTKEMDASWPEEALKAQAVVSRTFALWTADINRQKNLPYDIENSIFHQVYGVSSSIKIEKAVNDTVGQVLAFNGLIAHVFFHAACGGITAHTRDVWGGDYCHISSVSDPFCCDSPYFNWRKTFTPVKLSGILSMPSIENICIEGIDDCGRVTLLKFFLKNGKIKELTGHQFRMQVNNKASKILFNGPDVIPSTKFSISKNGGLFIFEGQGYGHGVGMCQWGAKAMAESGYDYLQILRHYFPEMEIGRLQEY